MPLRCYILLFVVIAFVTGIVPLSAWAFWGNEKSQVKECSGSPALCLAIDLLRNVEKGNRVALRPLIPRETGLPAAIGRRLYEDILQALAKVSKGRQEIIARSRLGKIWDSWENQYEADIERFIKETRADVEIICEKIPRPEAVGLSCTATALSSGKHVGEGSAVFPQKDIFIPEILDIAVTALAKDLLVGLEAAKPAKLGVLLDLNSGSSSELANFLGKRLLAALNPMLIAEQRTKRKQKELDQAVKGDSSILVSSEGKFTLNCEILPEKNRVTLQAKLLDGARQISYQSGTIDPKSIPARYLSSPGSLAKQYVATGVAIISKKLDRQSAIRAARNLARARVVAQALAIQAPAIREVRTEAHGMRVLQGTLDKGVPLHEQFRRLDDGGTNRLTYELRATVKHVGSKAHPNISAHLNKKVYRAGLDPISIRLSAKSAARIAVFGWGADNKVIRLYPNKLEPDLFLPAGGVLTLPRKDEARILSAPMPGNNNQQDHEALILVAANGVVPFSKIVPLAGTSVGGTMDVAIDVGTFFERLAEYDLAQMTIRILPYQVVE